MQKNLTVNEAGELVAEALDIGVCFFDTAQLYNNYSLLAAGLSLRPNAEAVIASKTYAYTAEAAQSALEEARIALNRDVIDVFLLHEQESEHTLRGHAAALEALYAAKASNKIKAVGLSTHYIAGVEAAVGAGLDVVHPLYNMSGLGIMDGTPDEMARAIARAHSAGLGVYAMKALGGGHFHMSAAKALGYVLADCNVDSVAVGIGGVQELRSNAFFFQTGSFPDDYCSLERRRTRSIWIDPACENCGACAAHCPSQALQSNGSAMECLSSKCVLCGYCAARCPNFYIKML